MLFDSGVSPKRKKEEKKDTTAAIS